MGRLVLSNTNPTVMIRSLSLSRRSRDLPWMDANTHTIGLNYNGRASVRSCVPLVCYMAVREDRPWPLRARASIFFKRRLPLSMSAMIFFAQREDELFPKM